MCAGHRILFIIDNWLWMVHWHHEIFMRFMGKYLKKKIERNKFNLPSLIVTITSFFLHKTKSKQKKNWQKITPKIDFNRKALSIILNRYFKAVDRYCILLWAINILKTRIRWFPGQCCCWCFCWSISLLRS